MITQGKAVASTGNPQGKDFNGQLGLFVCLEGKTASSNYKVFPLKLKKKERGNPKWTIR